MTAPRFWRERPSRYHLAATHCGACGKVYFPRRSVCSVCHRASIGKIKEIRLKGTGKVYSFSVLHEGHKDFGMQVPYVLAIILMDEGCRLTGQVTDCDPKDVQIGMRVKVAFRKLSEDGKAGTIHYGYKFIPDGNK